MKRIHLFDTTLRDGAQAEGISYTLHDRLAIVKQLDRLGIDYIEAGNPFSNANDMEFFRQMQQFPLTHAQLVAFGSTRRKDVPVEKDPNVQALLASGTQVTAIFGKASAMQVTQVLNTSLEQNLEMIYDTVSYLKAQNRTVFFDAEHFFDGYREDAPYALSCLEAAQRAGADAVVLCDTNGGTLPGDVFRIVSDVKLVFTTQIGIHCHNDIGCAVANSILAVEAGCTQVQGTYLGFGERCGNTNLSSLIPTLRLKMGYDCMDDHQLSRLTKAAHFIADISNVNLDKNLPYVGDSAFSHKGGMHVDGVRKNTASFEHISPETVGNKRNLLVSGVAGRSALLSIAQEIVPGLTKDSAEAQELTDTLKELEGRGYLFESAPASLELLITKKFRQFKPYFQIRRFKVIGEQDEAGQAGLSSAMIHIRVGKETEVTAAEGDGPVHALDRALKKAVMRFYPSVERLRLIDYKVRVMDSTDGTAATVRVLITTSDGGDVWTTVGVSRDIIKASLDALLDSIEYRLLQEEKRASQPGANPSGGE